MMNVKTALPPVQVRSHPDTASVKMRIPYAVEGKSYYIDVGVNLISADIDSMDKAIAPMKLRAAVKAALTDKVMVKYEGGHTEEGTAADVITDTVIARIRETL